LALDLVKVGRQASDYVPEPREILAFDADLPFLGYAANNRKQRCAQAFRFGGKPYM
jgi:hypothetical protein